MKKIFSKLIQKKSFNNKSSQYTYLQFPNNAHWFSPNYKEFAKEGYIKNVITNRCISLIAKGASSIEWKLFERSNTKKKEHMKHQLITLIQKPNQYLSSIEFLESLFSTLLISGNCFIKISSKNNNITLDENLELEILRSDRVDIYTNNKNKVTGYKYTYNQQETLYPINPASKKSQIIHIKLFHPLNDFYGLSPIESASYSIDQHNEAAKWNQSLLQNCARPGGALTVNKHNNDGILTDEQYARLKQQVNDEFTGAHNNGKPIILEGGLEWKEIGLSPKDMDFIESKYSSARDIALAFGVPPQILGIPGDNTYNNMAEARLTLWEQTILPLLNLVIANFNQKLVHRYYKNNLFFNYNKNNIPALSLKQEKLWKQINDAQFLSDEEKRELLGFQTSKANQKTV